MPSLKSFKKGFKITVNTSCRISKIEIQYPAYTVYRGWKLIHKSLSIYTHANVG